MAGEDPATLYAELAATRDHRVVRNGLVYVGWNARLINQGHYFYGFSHTPVHQLNLPERTFTVTCLRDPMKRLASHYNMLMDYAAKGADHPCMEIEGRWLGTSFDDFLDRIPSEDLCKQIHMFSADLDIDEAVARAVTITHLFFTDDFVAGVDQLNRKTGLGLKPVHVRRARRTEAQPIQGNPGCHPRSPPDRPRAGLVCSVPH